MHKWNDRVTSQYAVYCLLAILLLTNFYLYSDFDITVDEPLHRYYAESVFEYYKTLGKDRSYQKLFNLKYYGPFFDLSAYLLFLLPVGFDRYDAVHFLCSLFSVGGIYFSYLIARRILPKTQAIWIIPILYLSPLNFEYSFNQPKDIPFMALFVAATYYLLRLYGVYPQVPRSLWIRLAICIGLANAIRTVGVILYLILVLVVGIRFRQKMSKFFPWMKAIQFLAPLGLTAFAITTLFFPFLHSSPIRNYIETIVVFSKFPHFMDYLYLGEVINSINTPRSYAIVQLLVTSPELVILGILLFPLAYIWFRSRQAKATPTQIRSLIFVSAILFGILAVFLIQKPVFYSPRQFHFLYPFLSILSLVGLYSLSKLLSIPRWVFPSVLGACLLYMGYIIYIYHPSQGAYFNRMVASPLGYQSLFQSEFRSNKFAMRSLQAWIASNQNTQSPDSNKTWKLYNAQLDSAYQELEFVGFSKEVLDIFKQQMPFPLDLRTETVKAITPPSVQLTFNSQEADFFWEQDSAVFQGYRIESIVHDKRGDLTLFHIYRKIAPREQTKIPKSETR